MERKNYIQDLIQFINLNFENSSNLKINITVMFYYAGNIKELTGKITYLNSNKKELYLNNTKIYFNQIIQIKELNF